VDVAAVFASGQPGQVDRASALAGTQAPDGGAFHALFAALLAGRAERPGDAESQGIAARVAVPGDPREPEPDEAPALWVVPFALVPAPVPPAADTPPRDEEGAAAGFVDDPARTRTPVPEVALLAPLAPAGTPQPHPDRPVHGAAAPEGAPPPEPDRPVHGAAAPEGAPPPEPGRPVHSAAAEGTPPPEPVLPVDSAAAPEGTPPPAPGHQAADAAAPEGAPPPAPGHHVADAAALVGARQPQPGQQVGRGDVAPTQQGPTDIDSTPGSREQVTALQAPAAEPEPVAVGVPQADRPGPGRQAARPPAAAQAMPATRGDARAPDLSSPAGASPQVTASPVASASVQAVFQSGPSPDALAILARTGGAESRPRGVTVPVPGVLPVEPGPDPGARAWTPHPRDDRAFQGPESAETRDARGSASTANMLEADPGAEPGTRAGTPGVRDQRAFLAYRRLAGDPEMAVTPQHQRTGGGPATGRDGDGTPQTADSRRSTGAAAPTAHVVVEMGAARTPQVRPDMAAVVAEAPRVYAEPTADGEPLARAIVRSLQVQWRRDGGEARIKLQPEFLGDLTVSLRVQGSSVTAVLVADSPAVRAWIEAHQADLRRALQVAGLSLDRLDVDADGHASEGRDQAPHDRRPPVARQKPAAGRFEALL